MKNSCAQEWKCYFIIASSQIKEVNCASSLAKSKGVNCASSRAKLNGASCASSLAKLNGVFHFEFWIMNEKFEFNHWIIGITTMTQ